MLRTRPAPSVCLCAALVAAASVALASGTLAAPVKTEHVEAELVAAKTALVPGEPLTVALRLTMQKGWHTYWQNPGDSGLPTTLEWKLPAGISAGPIEWPAPHALPAGPLVNYGYDGEVLHLVQLTPQPTLPTGAPAMLRARADWLVCKEVCIPEGADLELALPVDKTAAPDPRWGAPIAAARAALPRPLEGWKTAAEGKGATIELKLVPPAGARDPGALQFFSFAESRIEPSAPQTHPARRRRVRADATRLVQSRRHSGTARRRADGRQRFVDDRARRDDRRADHGRRSPRAPSRRSARRPRSISRSPPAENGLSLALAIAFAFVGGIALNLMPCVFPVLSLKVLGFATHHDAKTTLRKEAFAFAAGVVVTFVALGLVLAALRTAGEQLGWGFQLQSPAVVTALAALFFVLALNLSGVFEFGQIAPSGIAEFTAKNRTVDALASGVLAVLIASPCTAPFMGAALGYAICRIDDRHARRLRRARHRDGRSPTSRSRCCPAGGGCFRARARGCCASSRCSRFPLYATVIWLAWVLGAQRDNDAVVRLLLALLCLGFALWTWRIVRTGGARPWGIAGVAALAGSVALAWPLSHRGRRRDADRAASSRRVAAGDADWQPYTPARVADLAASGRPVFVDFTAAWCVTCQVNKRLVLNTQDVRAAFARKNVALVRADWTRRDPDITRALVGTWPNGRAGVRSVSAGRKPVLLPEVLQQQTVLEALASL